MMQLDWQTAIATAIVGWSLLFLLRRINPFARQTHKTIGSCGSCAGCSDNAPKLHQLGKRYVKAKI